MQRRIPGRGDDVTMIMSTLGLFLSDTSSPFFRASLGVVLYGAALGYEHIKMPSRRLAAPRRVCERTNTVVSQWY